jgi:hypothetical protein
VLAEVTSAVRNRHTVNPKTILGYFAIVLGLLLTATVGATGTLAATGVYTDAIPWILGFAGFVFLFLLIGPFVVAWKDPSKLMLTQVTGTEYVQIQQRRLLGDSDQGERLELESLMTTAPVVSNEAPLAVASPPPEIEAGPSAASEEPDGRDAR